MPLKSSFVHLHLLCFQDDGELGLRAYTNQCWDQWDLSPAHHVVWLDVFGTHSAGFIRLSSQGGRRSFSSKPAWAWGTLLCLVAQTDVEMTDQKLSATQSTANKTFCSSPAGQWLFCLTFACGCKCFIKNCSIFLVCALWMGRFFSLVILCWGPCIHLCCFLCVQWQSPNAVYWRWKEQWN